MTEHSKSYPGPARIGLAVITAPRQAFEEILDRRLVLGGIAVAALAGCIQLLVVLFEHHYLRVGTLFELTMANPIAIVGKVFLIAYITYYVARLLGGDGNYTETLAVVGWSHVIMILTYAVAVGSVAVPALGSLVMVVPVWMVIVVGFGIQLVHSTTVVRGVLAHLIALMLFAVISMVFGKNVPTLQGSQLPIFSEAAEVAAKFLPSVWMSAAGLIFGTLILARELERPEPQARALAMRVGVAGVVVAALSTYVIVTADPVGRVARAHYEYIRGEYSRAIEGYEWVLQRFPADLYAAVYLPHALYAAADDTAALKKYEELTAKPHGPLRMQGLLGIGAISLAEGDLEQAEGKLMAALEFSKGEPNVWLAVTRMRAGNYSDATESAEESLKHGRSGLAHLVLVDAYAATGKPEEADEHLQMLLELSPYLEERFGPLPEDWIGATASLTRDELKFPLMLSLPPGPHRTSDR